MKYLIMTALLLGCGPKNLPDDTGACEVLMLEYNSSTGCEVTDPELCCTDINTHLVTYTSEHAVCSWGDCPWSN